MLNSKHKKEENPHTIIRVVGVLAQILVLFSLPLLFDFLFLYFYDSIHSDRIFYSTNWGSSLIVNPRDNAGLLVALDFYFQILVEVGATIIFASLCCVPFVLVFFPRHGFAVTLIYALVGMSLLFATNWPVNNIPTYGRSYASYWMVAVAMIGLPLSVDGVVAMLRRELFGYQPGK